MDFYGTMKKVQNNVSVTENGMQGYKATFHPLLDMNFKISSYRHLKDEDICNDIDKIVTEAEDAQYLLKFLFMVRDVREGQGERRLFRVALKHLVNNVSFDNKKEIISDLIKNQIATYGRYDDLFIFVGTEYEQLLIETIKNQLRDDFKNMQANKSISLLAKWMPSENTSSKETKALATLVRKALGADSKTYRKTLSALRAYLKVTETYTSANEWDKIDYNQVPSKANLKYKDAFLKHDEERRRDYLAALRVGVDKDGNAVKINSSVNYPHEIVSKYSSRSIWSRAVKDYDETLEQLWKNLKQKEGLKDTIVVRDGSGSMTCRIGDGSTAALDVSTALALYCAERLNGTFKDKFITFSRKANLIDLADYSSLQSKLIRAYEESDCSNTNIESVFNLILNTAVEGGISPEDMPKQILIISDMEFDAAYNFGFNADTNVFKNASAKYAQHGYKLPKLVFWNVSSRTNTIPIKQNENGVILVSGFSVNTLNMVLNGETDPFKALVKELDVERYSAIPLLDNVGTSEVKSKSVKKTTRIKETPDFLK